MCFHHVVGVERQRIFEDREAKFYLREFEERTIPLYNLGAFFQVQIIRVFPLQNVLWKRFKDLEESWGCRTCIEIDFEGLSKGKEVMYRVISVICRDDRVVEKLMNTESCFESSDFVYFFATILRFVRPLLHIVLINSRHF